MAISFRNPIKERTYDYLFENPQEKPCIENVFYWTLKGSIIGVTLGGLNTLLIYKPPTYALAAQRIAFYGFPFAGMGATIGATACILSNLRKKDDHYNYFIGGLAAGGIYGKMFNSFPRGIRMGMLLAVFFSAKKFSLMQGWSWNPEDNVTPMKGHERPDLYDFSILKDPGPSVRRTFDGLR
ncbi:NADH dehydrogenase [ubiquinone] 1 alpha subcomplex subunit 11 [Centruroides vittatus]|uniref:NADH dehydrogenase [ubiquinone] 1 alpha subcomplex subunit 11 n=1 Tax=Centruroides vittatus TaxID=120091 RepID=UPI0035102DC2